MSEKDVVLERIFTNAESIMDELAAANGEFNSQDFLRHVMQDQPEAYIDLLVLQKKARHPFKEAHQGIGQMLKRRALAQGFVEVGVIDEESLFRKRTQATLYRRRPAK